MTCRHYFFIIPIIFIDWRVSLSYSVYLTNVEITEPEAESDTHASFESGFRNNSIVQNNNYSSYHNYQNTPSFLAPLYTLCFLKKHHCSCIHTAPGESREEVCVPLTPSLGYHLLTLHCHVFRCPSPSAHIVVKSCGFEPYEGNKYFPGLHVCYTIFYSKLACGIEKGGGKIQGWMAPKMSQLDFLCWSHQVFFFFCFFIFIYPRKQTGPTSNPNFWLGSPKSVTMTSMIGTWSILGVLISITVFP